jgi:hypothetical protein
LKKNQRIAFDANFCQSAQTFFEWLAVNVKKTVKQTLWINAGLFRHVPFQSALNAIGGELEKAAWVRSNSRRRRDASSGVH